MNPHASRKITKALTSLTHRFGGMEGRGKFWLLILFLWSTWVFFLCWQLASGHSLVHSMENRSMDWRLQHGSETAEHPDLVFIGFDLSIAETLFPEDMDTHPALPMMNAQWPWNRGLWGLAVERLLDAGARVVGIDIVFDGSNPTQDAQLKAILDRYPDRVVVGAREETALSKGRPTAILSPLPTTLLPDWDKEIFDPQGRIGLVNIVMDQDQIVRHYVYTIDGFFLPTMDAFATRVLRKGGHQNIIEQIPTTPMLRFAPVERYQPIMLWDIFLPDSWERNFNKGKFFENKLVIIGPYGTWSKDMHQTSISNAVPMEGPKIHLNAVAAALQNDFIHAAGTTAHWSWLFASLLFPLLVFNTLQNRSWCYLIWLSGNLLIALISYLVYQQYSYMTPFVFPLLGWNITWVILISAETVWSWMEKKRIRSTLNRYLSKEVAATLITGKNNYYQALGGVKREAVVLFSDLRGFTSLSEYFDPAQLVSLLNEYLTEMVEEIFLHHGRLDKFMGDAVMAAWGDLHGTKSISDNCIDAVNTSVGMIRRLERMNSLWQAAGKPTLNMGIGIHCGELIFGNLGSEHRMELTVIGDTVNLGSRLEGQTKVYQQPLLVSIQVKQLTENHYCWRSVDIVRVKGRSQPLEIFTLNPTSPQQTPTWLTQYHQAAQQYRNGSLDFGLSLWQQLAAEQPEDFLIQRYRLSAEMLLQGAAIEKLDGLNPLWFGDTIRPEK